MIWGHSGAAAPGRDLVLHLSYEQRGHHCECPRTPRDGVCWQASIMPFQLIQDMNIQESLGRSFPKGPKYFNFASENLIRSLYRQTLWDGVYGRHSCMSASWRPNSSFPNFTNTCLLTLSVFVFAVKSALCRGLRAAA